MENQNNAIEKIATILILPLLVFVFVVKNPQTRQYFSLAIMACIVTLMSSKTIRYWKMLEKKNKIFWLSCIIVFLVSEIIYLMSHAFIIPLIQLIAVIVFFNRLKSFQKELLNVNMTGKN